MTQPTLQEEEAGTLPLTLISTSATHLRSDRLSHQTLEPGLGLDHPSHLH